MLLECLPCFPEESRCLRLLAGPGEEYRFFSLGPREDFFVFESLPLDSSFFSFSTKLFVKLKVAKKQSKADFTQDISIRRY